MTSRKPRRRSGSVVDPLDARSARVAALDILARRDRCSADLQGKLLDKGYDPQLVEALLAELGAQRLLDDRRYVEQFVSSHAERGQGPQRVRAELQKMGLDRGLVDGTIEGYPDWISQLHRARCKKFGNVMPTDWTERQRQARFLGYRGFTGAQIHLALGFDTDIDLEP